MIVACIACGRAVEVASERDLGSCPSCNGDTWEDASGTYARPCSYGRTVNPYPYPGANPRIVPRYR